MVLMDFRPAKEKIGSKIKSLTEQLGDRIVGEFLTAMRSLKARFAHVESKMSTVLYDIDAIIDQIEFIQVLQVNSRLIDDLDEELGGVRDQKDFLDSLRLRLPSPDFMDFFSLFASSRGLKELVVEKNRELPKARERLLSLLDEEVREIEESAQACKDEVDRFQEEGLQSFAEFEATLTKDSPKEQLRLYRDLKARPAKQQNDPFLNPGHLAAMVRVLERMEQSTISIKERIEALHAR